MANVKYLSYDGLQYLVNKIKIHAIAERITYNDLVTKRNNGELQFGKYYMITDYVTIVNNTGQYISIGEGFAIIVLATSERTLSEEAFAYDNSDEEGYFRVNNANLNAWKLWYCLDNDTNRFEWASGDGKGVIYRMIDEHGNDCPYDFKNIKFKRFELAPPETPSGTRQYTVQLCTNIMNQFSSNVLSYIWGGTYNDSVNGRHYWDRTIYSVFTGYTKFFFTFSYIDTDDIKDLSITGNYCKNNVIKQYYRGNKFLLNDIVFFNINSTSNCYNNSFDPNCGINSFGSDCYSNSFGSECYSNTFGLGCRSNIFVTGNYGNSFGNRFNGNSLGDNCYYNSFSDRCTSNILADGCNSNSFGDDCYSNRLDSDCYYNSFTSSCNNNSFGVSCTANTFDDGCYNNIFGDYFIGNNIGPACYSNSFGNGCSNNSFGNNCYNNTFGNGCSSNNLKNNCYSNGFGNGCYSNNVNSSCNFNTFSNGCHDNIVGNGCCSNSFGPSCYSNQLVGGCWYNSFGANCNIIVLHDKCNYNNFGNNCYDIRLYPSCNSNRFGASCGRFTFDQYCEYNSFGNSCGRNQFGSYSRSNSFGNECHSNTVGGYFCYNSFGNNCSFNSFRMGDDTSSALRNYCYCNHFDDGCSFITIWNNASANSSNILQNIRIKRGVNSNNRISKSINITTLNNEYCITVANSSDGGDLLIYCEEDCLSNDEIDTIF